ncbi:CatB-related O-acetyltransferase [Vibrio tritonius]|uniref:CatB-related O-acetyltransferase n=1 Tax=Vibrio tritonius TaxID=1435069 RepID=UPI0009E7484B|nr:CatB-related O-acetyltransferase [Vibrio tritonius]
MYIIKRLIKYLCSSLINIKLMLTKRNIKIGHGVYISNSSILHGDNLINDYCRLIDVELGRYSYVSPLSIIINTKIGRYCSIGPGTKIGLGLHPIDKLSTSPFIYNKSLFKEKRKDDFELVEIGNDVWIGANALVMGGVKIATGAVIGSGAVVTHDVEPYEIVVGVPAKVIKKRFNDEKIAELLSSEWWRNNPKDVLCE